MESFYGGRPGASFVIVKSFPTSDTMIEEFKKGPLYNEVYFDEYVIIENPNQPDYSQNGNIYRRGYDFNNEDTGGAEYIGSIRGPAGPVAELQMYSFEAINSSNNNYQIYSSDDNDMSEKAFKLVPGKDGDTFNDNIAWRYYYYTDTNNNNNKRKIRLGFKIPYPVFNFSIQSVDADEPLSINKIEMNNPHPFYHQYKINMPKMTKGDSITKISVLQVQQINGIANNADIDYSNYSTDIDTQNSKKLADVTNETIILVYDLTQYDKANNVSNVRRYYLSDFQFIKTINMTEYGYLEFLMPDGTTTRSSISILPSLETIDLNEYGEISTIWKNINGDKTQTVKTNQELQWIHDVEYTDNGNLNIIWNTQKKDDNGAIIYDTEGNPVRNSKILTLKNNQHLITDLMINNQGWLCQTYMGINSEFAKTMNLINVKENEISNIVTTLESSSPYYYDTNNQTLWKKIFNLDQLIAKHMKEMYISSYETSYYSKGTIVDELVNGQLIFQFNKNAPYGYNLSGIFDLPKKIPAQMGIIQSYAFLIHCFREDNYDQSYIKQIYLAPTQNEKLQDPIPYYNENNEGWASISWDQINSEILYNEYIASERETNPTIFGTTSENEQYSLLIFKEIFKGAPDPTRDNIIKSTQAHTYIKPNMFYGGANFLTGKNYDNTSDNLNSRATIWNISVTSDGKLKINTPGRSGTDYELMKGKQFQINVVLHIQFPIDY